MDKYYAYLDRLRESGVTNMFGATLYLQEAFPELADDWAFATRILTAWMKERSK